MVFINASQGSIKITGSVREDGGGDHNTTSLQTKMEEELGYKDRKITGYKSKKKTRLTYNCAHLRSTKESLILEYDI